MKNLQALESFARREQLDQKTVRQLLDNGLITADDVTTLATPPGQREYLPISMTLKGQRLLDTARDRPKKSGATKKKRKQSLGSFSQTMDYPL